MAQRMDFNTPVGRIVSGSTTEKRKVGFEGKPIPEDKQQYEIGLAIEKTNPGLGDFWNTIVTAAQQGYAQNAQVLQQIQSGFGVGTFAYKMSDGDKPGADGTVNPNTAGCLVFYFSTSFPITTCNTELAQIPPEEIYKGCYADIFGDVVANGFTGTQAGVYLGVKGIRFIAHGERIITGPSIQGMFGNAAVPTHLPTGASMTPSAPAPMAMGAPVAPVPNPAPVMPGPGGAVVPTAPAGVTGVPGMGAPVTQIASPGNPTHPPHTGITKLPGTP